MQLSIVSYDGTDINDGTNYEAWFDGEGPVIYGAQTVLVNRAENFPKLAKKRINGKVIPIYIKCLGTAHFQIQDLKKLFDPYTQDETEFVIKDTADSNKEYYVCATVTDLPQLLGEAVLQINLYAADPVWKEYVESSANWTYTTSGTTSNNVTTGGNKRTPPRIDVTPQTAKSSNNYTQRRFITVYNPNSNSAYPDYALDLTNGGMDSAALESAGKMQHDIDDWRITVEGVEVDRWSQYSTTASDSKLWINLSLDRGIILTLKTAIAGTGAVTDIKITSTTANIAAIKRLPQAGKLLIGTELFTYTSVNVKTLTISGVTRAAKGTSEAAHSAGDSIYWVQYEIWMLYGNSSASAPTVDDTKKPILDLSNSTNTSWVYTVFKDDDGLRTASWKPAINSTTGKESTTYTEAGGTNVDPATDMGMQILAYQKYGKWQSETASLEWRLAHPAGITTVTSSGLKYRYGSEFPAKAALQRSKNGTTWEDVFNEATPGSANSWTAWSHAGSTVGSAYKYIRFLFSGSIKGTADNEADFEVSDVTVNLNSSLTPVVSVGSEITNYYLDLTLTNTATGEFITVQWPMTTSDTLTIDCENKTVTYSDGTPALAPLETSTIRQGWLDLLPGQTNGITYEDTGTGNALVTVYWRDRMN